MKEVDIYTFDDKNYVLLDRIEDYLFLSNEKNDHDMMIRKIENEDEETLLPLESDEEFEKHFGFMADKKRKLYNGMIKCDLYMYFKPERKPFKNQMVKNSTRQPRNTKNSKKIY